MPHESSINFGNHAELSKATNSSKLHRPGQRSIKHRTINTTLKAKKEIPPNQTKIDSFFQYRLKESIKRERILKKSDKNNDFFEEEGSFITIEDSDDMKKPQCLPDLKFEAATDQFADSENIFPNNGKIGDRIVSQPVIIKATSPHLGIQNQKVVAPVSKTNSLKISSKKSKRNNPFKSLLDQSNSIHKKKTQLCPSYKVIAGTTFAVDAFRFGAIKNITHYFLTHFHADHYVGLTRKFAMPLVLSSITAKLVRNFIPIEECFIYEIELNRPKVIAGVEVTAIDANHCPGAVMFIFKLSNGKCVLHTGDFRASPEMESEPIFWNNSIDIIYLDTTYISVKYVFCTQDESVIKAQELIDEFQRKHDGKKILYICGSYLVGKEKFWSSIARLYSLSVWTEDRRRRALEAMQYTDVLDILCDNSMSADMHVISMEKLSYFKLVEYFKPYAEKYDLCFAIRPSGWEKDSKPQYRGKINIIGVEYSEHSSCNELRRFIMYLQPQQVISTVPIGRDLHIVNGVPEAWYKYNKFPTQHRSFQPSITNYLKLNKKSLKHTEDKKQEYDSPAALSLKCYISPEKLSLNADADDDWLF